MDPKFLEKMVRNVRLGDYIYLCALTSAQETAIARPPHARIVGVSAQTSDVNLLTTK